VPARGPGIHAMATRRARTFATKCDWLTAFCFYTIIQHLKTVIKMLIACSIEGNVLTVKKGTDQHSSDSNQDTAPRHRASALPVAANRAGRESRVRLPAPRGPAMAGRIHGRSAPTPPGRSGGRLSAERPAIFLIGPLCAGMIVMHIPPGPVGLGRRRARPGAARAWTISRPCFVTGISEHS
jgi:hypothetical protein